MENTFLYQITAISFVVLSVVCLAFVIYALSYALKRSLLTEGAKKKVFYGVLLGMVIWLGFISGLALSGFIADFSTIPPRFILLIFPLLIVITAITFSKVFAEIIIHVPSSWLLHIQFFRFFVEILLWMLFIQEIIPVQLTFEGRNFDILVGITGPVVAYLVYHKKLLSENVVFYWNIAGLLLLINIVGMAILSTPSPFRMFMNEPANTIVVKFPFVLLPGILVPLAYTSHFFSLRKMYLKKAGRMIRQEV